MKLNIHTGFYIGNKIFLSFCNKFKLLLFFMLSKMGWSDMGQSEPPVDRFLSKSFPRAGLDPTMAQ